MGQDKGIPCNVYVEKLETGHLLGFKTRQGKTWGVNLQAKERTGPRSLSALRRQFCPLCTLLSSSVILFNNFWNSSLFLWVEEKYGPEIFNNDHVMDGLLCKTELSSQVGR